MLPSPSPSAPRAVASSGCSRGGGPCTSARSNGPPPCARAWSLCHSRQSMIVSAPHSLTYPRMPHFLTYPRRSRVAATTIPSLRVSVPSVEASAGVEAPGEDIEGTSKRAGGGLRACRWAPGPKHASRALGVCPCDPAAPRGKGRRGGLAAVVASGGQQRAPLWRLRRRCGAARGGWHGGRHARGGAAAALGGQGPLAAGRRASAVTGTGGAR